jgi:hypothetical protein
MTLYHHGDESLHALFERCQQLAGTCGTGSLVLESGVGTLAAVAQNLAVKKAFQLSVLCGAKYYTKTSCQAPESHHRYCQKYELNALILEKQMIVRSHDVKEGA